MMAMAEHGWIEATRIRIRSLQDNLLETAAWAREAGADPAVTEMMLLPYRSLLEEVYERDMPLAKLANDSDLLLHVHGPSASGATPRVSVVTKLLTQTRDQVTRLAKLFGGVTTLRVPTGLDMGFVGVASGSLFLGFAADPASDGDMTRQAVSAIGEASVVVAEENSTIGDLAKLIDDPAARDMAVAAVRHLSPSGQIGVSEIEILGKQVRIPTALTTTTRRRARGIMAQRIVGANEPVSFVGTVREADLDASRFEIRNVDGQAEDVRCAHELDEEEVKSLMDKRVRVSGKAERGRNGSVRLLWVDVVEPLT